MFLDHYGQEFGSNTTGLRLHSPRSFTWDTVSTSSVCSLCSTWAMSSCSLSSATAICSLMFPRAGLTDSLFCEMQQQAASTLTHRWEAQAVRGDWDPEMGVKMWPVTIRNTICKLWHYNSDELCVFYSYCETQRSWLSTTMQKSVTNKISVKLKVWQTQTGQKRRWTLSAFIVYFFSAFTKAGYLSLRLDAVSKKTAHQDELQFLWQEIDQLRGRRAGWNASSCLKVEICIMWL